MPDESEIRTRASQRDALASELDDLRKKIVQAERRAGEPVVLVAAINQAERDRDAMTSPVVEDLRETVEELCDDIDQIWAGLVNLLQKADVLAKESPNTPRPDSLVPLLEEAHEIRGILGQQLEAADIDYLELPQLPSIPNFLNRPGDGKR